MAIYDKADTYLGPECTHIGFHTVVTPKMRNPYNADSMQHDATVVFNTNQTSLLWTCKKKAMVIVNCVIVKAGIEFPLTLWHPLHQPQRGFQVAKVGFWAIEAVDTECLYAVTTSSFTLFPVIWAKALLLLLCKTLREEWRYCPQDVPDNRSVPHDGYSELVLNKSMDD